MFHFLTQFGAILGIGQDEATRNTIALIVCISLYGVFILRDK